MHDFTNYRQQLTACDWQMGEQYLAPPIAEWLLHTDSLTQKLQAKCADLEVRLVSQGWQAEFWVREVLLKGDGKDWIFAQTLLPRQTIEQVAQAVLTLGEKPIGLWLFPQNPLRQSLEWRQDPHSALYARRSCLCLQNYPLEIRELFLASFTFDDK